MTFPLGLHYQRSIREGGTYPGYLSSCSLFLWTAVDKQGRSFCMPRWVMGDCFWKRPKMDAEMTHEWVQDARLYIFCHSDGQLWICEAQLDKTIQTSREENWKRFDHFTGLVVMAKVAKWFKATGKFPQISGTFKWEVKLVKYIHMKWIHKLEFSWEVWGISVNYEKINCFDGNTWKLRVYDCSKLHTSVLE